MVVLFDYYVIVVMTFDLLAHSTTVRRKNSCNVISITANRIYVLKGAKSLWLGAGALYTLA